MSEVNNKPFDVVVGRLILEYLPDPGAILRSRSKLVRPGGIIIIQDRYWAPLLQLTARLPLWAKCASLIHQTFELSGANMDMEHRLYRAFSEASPMQRRLQPFGLSTASITQRRISSRCRWLGREPALQGAPAP